jgi:hypothetical protein
LPLLLKSGLSFYPSIAVAIGATVVSYFAMVSALNYFGVKL